VTVSIKRGVAGATGGGGKIGLTMRQPGLGKLEWIEEERKGAKT
jgi:DNA-directed RNA polymerase subunit E'/Rpb7